VAEAASAQVRLLVDQSQVGCILGKGGSIINELRRSTGASVRVLSKQEIPACAAHLDEVLQVRCSPPSLKQHQAAVGVLVLSCSGSRARRRAKPRV